MANRYDPLSSYALLWKEISSFPTLDNHETLDLVRRAQQGDEKARKTVYLGNLRRVAFLARRFRNPIRNEQAFMDFYSEGLFGIDDAINGFDSSKGSFSSYLFSRLHARMSRYGREFERGFIKIPDYVFEFVHRFKNSGKRIEDLSNEEILEIVESKPESLKTIKAAIRMRNANHLDDGVIDSQRAANTSSLKIELRDYLNGTLDYVLDSLDNGFVEDFSPFRTGVHNRVRRIVEERLSPRERFANAPSWKDIADDEGVSRAAVGYTERDIKEFLRNDPVLKDYWEELVEAGRV